MKFIKSKKAFVLLGVMAVVAIAAFGAYAYLTSNGSGSGTAKVGANTTSIHLAASVADGLVPGSSEPVSFSAWNTSSTTTGYVAAVTLTSVTDPGGAPGCVSYLAANQTDFSFDSLSISEGNAIAAGTTSGTAVALTNGTNLNWANSDSADQTPCLNETLTVNIASS